MSNFRVGQKVVCVDASPSADGFVTILRQNAVYTIRQIEPPDILGRCGLRFFEIDDAPVRPGVIAEFFNGSYNAQRFRPLIDRKSSTESGVEILRKIAREVSDKTPVKIKERI